MLLTAAAALFCNFTVPSHPPSLPAARAFIASSLAAASFHLASDLVICLAPGVHDVSSSPHLLLPHHSVQSGPGRIVWRGGGAAQLSGGAQVTGWAAATLGGSPVFVAPLPPPVLAAGTIVRQLWVAGSRAARTVVQAVAPFLGGCAGWSSALTSGFTCSSVPPAWLVNSTRGIEFTWPIVLHNWVSPRCTVASIVPLPPPQGGITGPLPGVSAVSADGLLPRGNVTGHVEYAGDFADVEGCAGACVSAAACTGYTWHDASVGGGYANECFFRIDGEWAPTSGWAGHFSGRKQTSGEFNITLAAPCGLYLLAEGGALPVTAEAAPVFPLPAGSFFHDLEGGLLYYALAANQTALDLESDAWVAAQEVLMGLEGVSGHVFEGVGFSYGAWGQANSGDGFVDSQAAVYACTPGAPFCVAAADGGAVGRAAAVARGGAGSGGAAGSAEPRGNVRVSGGSGVAFLGCTFTHLGAAYALSIMGGAKNPSVTGCNFSDLSGGFLKLGSVSVAQNGGSDPSLWDSGASITHNVAEDMAVEYDGACGYFGGFLFSADVSHNSVSDAGYSGFSQGWGWGTVFPQGVGNNTISFVSGALARPAQAPHACSIAFSPPPPHTHTLTTRHPHVPFMRANRTKSATSCGCCGMGAGFT